MTYTKWLFPSESFYSKTGNEERNEFLCVVVNLQTIFLLRLPVTVSTK